MWPQFSRSAELFRGKPIGTWLVIYCRRQASRRYETSTSTRNDLEIEHCTKILVLFIVDKDDNQNERHWWSVICMFSCSA